MRFSRLAVVCAVVMALALPVIARAQAVYGSINGTVTDTSGAVVPNATVTVTDVAKGTKVSVKSNASGEYVAEHLIPDTYDVKVEAQGFETFNALGVLVQADTSPKIDASLKVGSSSQTVSVSADTIPELKTDRADVATEFTTKEVENLPIPDRNFANLQLLLPGAQSLSWNHAADENPQASKQIQVDGQAFGGVAYQLDGTDNQDPILGIIVINPPLDAIQDTKITTQNFDAEFGKAVSSFISAQTKSGSNHFHGSAFDYRESSANLGTDPYTQFPGTTFPPGLKNQFGGSIGGPIFKDHLFFFGDYQGVRQKVGTAESASVPTAHLVSTCLGQTVASNGIAGCDFSEYAIGILGSASDQLIYQQTGGGSVPYPGNVIPAGQLSTQALALLKLLQPYAPNTGGTVAAGSLAALKNNYSASGTGLFNNNQWDVRVDDAVSQNIHAFTRFSRFTDVLSGTTMFGAAGGPGFGIGGYGGVSNGADDSLAAGMDISVSPKLLTDWRIGYYRYNVIDHKYDQSTEFATQLGIPGMNIAGNAFTSGAPGFNIADADRSGNQGPNNPTGGGAQYGSGLNITRCNCPLTEREDQMQFVNNWTKLMGNHAYKFGVDLRYARNLRVPSDSDRTGLLSFAPGPTSDGGSTGGLGMATFVLGNVTQLQRYVSVSTNAKEFQKRDFFYVQDTWRPRPSLTVNYGIRYELYFPESVNGKGNGSLMELNGGSGGYQTDGYLRVAGYGNVPTNMGWNPATNAWNPRIGIAWSPDSKTVVRTGYGRSFDLGVFGSIFGHVVTQNLPVLANQSVTSPTTTSAAFTLTAGPPANVFPTVPSDGLLPAPGFNISPKARPNSLRLPTLDAWNLSVERAITPTLSLTVAYVGNKGTHTLSAGDGNNTNPNEAGIFLPNEYSVTGATLHYDPSVSTSTTPAGSTAVGIAANGGTQVSNFLQRFYGHGVTACTDPAYEAQLMALAEPNVTPGMCGWTQSIGYYGDDQNTNFNALDVTLAKQYTHGLSFNAQYAWQRSFNFNSGYYTWDKGSTYGPDDWLRTQQFVVYGVYQLPFGHGQMWANNGPRWQDEVIGGWQFSPVLNWSNGLPFTLNVGGGCGASVPGSAPCYPVGKRGSLHTGLSAFNPITHSRTFFTAANTAGFTEAGMDQIGTVGRNSFYGPGYFNGDLSLQKNFPIHESILAQFRIDAFNGFNHINPGTPSSTVTGSAGTITSEPALGIYTNPRQLQFSLRVDF
ncbi:MAG TPA: TonB-dependent receptor [Acidobacteriaceae bacterium]|nr:TonB-dependent receptor [Acidobacteriaceae bacterium]